MKTRNRLADGNSSGESLLMHISQKTVRLAMVVGLTLTIGTFLYPVHNRMLELGWFKNMTVHRWVSCE